MQFSYSRVGIYNQCPRRFKYQYIDELTTIQDPGHDDALVVGNSLHLGIETTPGTMLKHYYSHYPLIDDKQVNEAIKLEVMVNKVYKVLDGVNILHQEYTIDTPDFKGIVDLMVQNEDGSIDVFDFKYSNNIDRYMESKQLHIYKYYLEQEGYRVNKLGFIFIPKTGIRQKKTESIYQFRKRLLTTVNEMKIVFMEVKYQEEKVVEFQEECRKILTATDYPKNESKLCDWCEFKNYCMKGETYMLLPKNEKREINLEQGVKLWLYGSPFAGKSYLANKFKDALFLNTDGNVKFIDSPYVEIKDDVKAEGRIKNRIFAWDTFKEAIDEILIGNHDFKTIVVDLLDDIYEAARLKTYDKLGVEHEHDAGFGKGYDMVRTEFLPQIRRLTNSKYNVILISHEVTSEFIKKSGDKLSTVSTPLPGKIANKIAGMVDIVARVTNEPGEGRMLNFKTSTTMFGGGRLTFDKQKIDCDYIKFMEQYNKAAVEMSIDNMAGVTGNTMENTNERESKGTAKQTVVNGAYKSTMEEAGTGEAAEAEKTKRTRRKKEE